MFREKNGKLFAISGESDQMLQNAASDLGLYCASITRLVVPRIKWVKQISEIE